MAPEYLTAVIIAYRKNRLNNRLIFGSPVLRVRRGWRRELAIFKASQVFGYERWRADWYGTQDWRLFVCLASKSGVLTAPPGVIPGVDLLLHTKGAVRVKRALAAISLLKARGVHLESIPPAYWRRLHNDIENGAFDLNIFEEEYEDVFQKTDCRRRVDGALRVDRDKYPHPADAAIDV